MFRLFLQKQLAQKAFREETNGKNDKNTGPDQAQQQDEGGTVPTFDGTRAFFLDLLDEVCAS